MRLARRLAQVSPSQTLAAKQAAADLRARGVSVIDLGPGEPDQGSAPHVVAAAKEALDRGETHYSAAAGLPALRQALARDLGRHADAPVSADGILVTSGGKSAIFYIMLALLDEGDEVVLPTPCWVSFPEQARLAGGRPVPVPCRPEDGFRPRIEDLASAVTGRTRLVVINSPCNPTGAVVDGAFWDGLTELARERDLLVLSDETYLDFVYDGAEAPSALTRASRLGERLVVVGSFSKTFAMTGWRVGFALAAPPLARALQTLQSQDTTHPATFAQHGALAALEGPRDGLQDMVREYAARRRLMLDGLGRVPGIEVLPPDGAFYVFPDVTGAMARLGCADDAEFALRALKEAGVAMVAGSAFGGPGCVRLTYAVSRDAIREGTDRLARWVESAR